MKRIYLKSAVTMGLLLPMLIIGIAALITNSVKNKHLKGFKAKQAAYRNDQILISTTNQVREQLADKSDFLTSAASLMNPESYQAISNIIVQEAGKSETKSMKISGQNRIKNTKSMSGGVDSHSDGIQLKLHGTYSEIQKSLITLELTHPNLFATNFSLKPADKLIEINLSYLIWTSQKD